jgi:hypothetical protein
MFSGMREWLILVAHLIVTMMKVAAPGGVQSVVAESLILKQPGPKGPSDELIALILEMKRRNPRWGCPRIASQIAHAFGSKSTRTYYAGFWPGMAGVQ